MLNQTITVKMKYENIIKRLIENDQSRDLVLKAIEYFQLSHNQQQQYASNDLSHGLQNMGSHQVQSLTIATAQRSVSIPFQQAPTPTNY